MAGHDQEGSCRRAGSSKEISSGEGLCFHKKPWVEVLTWRKPFGEQETYQKKMALSPCKWQIERSRNLVRRVRANK